MENVSNATSTNHIDDDPIVKEVIFIYIYIYNMFRIKQVIVTPHVGL